MIPLNDPRIDAKIRQALCYAYNEHKLSVVIAVTDINETRLREIMMGKKPLSLAERARLAPHLS